MLIILIYRWQVLSYLIRMPLLNQANHAIWQKSWSTSIVLTVFPWILEVNASKWEKRVCPFSSLSPRRKKTTKIVLQSVGFEINRERQGLLLHRWNYREIEFHEFLSERSQLFRPRSVQANEKFATGPAPYKIGRRTFLKVYCNGRAVSRKTPGSGLLSIFPGRWRTFTKCIE